MHVLQGFSFIVYIIFQCHLVVYGLKQAGSPCKLSGGKGVCLLVKDCTEAKNSLAINGFTNLTGCGFVSLDQLVCCPSVQNRGSSDEVVVSTRKSGEVCNSISQDVKSMVAPHIFGGGDAKEHEFPHMAALGYEDTDGIDFQCGASVISNRFLLTAAHCTRRTPKIVRLGITKLDGENPQDFSVKRAALHPNYNYSHTYNDIALIEIEKNISFTEKIYPACLYLQSDVPNSMIVTGWGKLSSETGDDRSNTLQKVTVAPTSQQNCSTYYTRLSRTIDNTQICAGSSEADACQGDSGGPLQIEIHDGVYSVVGIVSYGSYCGGKIPGVYTKVSEYIDWIESIVWPS
ncbi:venom protease-like [Anoplophora glabripennis]|uniref:venom protease-like n=1 Tax=Anoplophora glabripennis TaxID=217634 RepID=UPI0008739E43|nr:venom protease-like [Anoplophora glabripennis]